MKRISVSMPPHLDAYWSILFAGLSILETADELPSLPEGERRLFKRRISEEDLKRIDALRAGYGVRDRNTIILAALQAATRANIGPLPKPD